MLERSFLFRGNPRRLDVFLAEVLAPLSRSQIQRHIKERRVTVNGAAAPARERLNPGDKVAVHLPAFSSLPAAAADSVPVLHEDAEIIVVDKPAGLVVHPAGPHRSDTLIQRLWPKLAPAWSKKIVPGDAARPGVVHRLDRGTSGVMVIAKTPAAAENLSRQFAGRSVKKMYLALVEGLLTADQGEIQSMVGRSRSAPHKMATNVPGRWSELSFLVLKRFPRRGPRGRTLIEVRPLTGRTHQIRVQLASLGHPVAGDRTYGLARAGDKGRPFLHAARLILRHPRTGRRMEFNAGLPDDLKALIDGRRSKVLG